MTSIVEDDRMLVIPRMPFRMSPEDREEVERAKALLRWARAAANGHAALHRTTIDEALQLAAGQGRALPPEPAMALAFLENERGRRP